MIRLNMLPEVKREYIRARKLQAKVISIAILASIVAGGLILLLTLWVYGAQTLQKNGLTDSINKNMKSLKAVKDIDKYVAIQNQLANIDSLHDSKSVYSRLFTVLPKLNPAAPNSVRLNSFGIDGPTKTATFEGQTASFTALQTFRDTLQNAKLSYRLPDTEENAEPENLFSSVVIDTQSIARGSKGEVVVSFKIIAVHNDFLFQRGVTVNDVLVPNKETTQSTVDAPSVFAPTQPTTQEEQ